LKGFEFPILQHRKIKSVNPPSDAIGNRENIPLTRFDFPIYLAAVLVLVSIFVHPAWAIAKE